MTGLSNILQNLQSFPLIFSLACGFFVAINPCTIATNITALSLLNKDNKNFTKKGIIFTLGKSITYIILGWVLCLVTAKTEVAMWIHDYFGKIIGPVFLIAGLLMLNIIHLHGHSDKCATAFGKIQHRHNYAYALALGIILAFAFCPASGLIYFGMLMPLAMTTENATMPLIMFSAGAAIPLLFLLAASTYGMNKFKERLSLISDFSIWARRIIAILFIICGVMFIIEFYFEHHH